MNTKGIFVEKNLYESYYNDENNTCDLFFKDECGSRYILRNAPFMKECSIDEYYWTDETIKYALENGGKPDIIHDMRHDYD